MTTRQPQHTSPEQLTLLPVSELPLQFRLDQRTRQRGLAHIAAIRRQLANKPENGQRSTDVVTRDDRAA
jgi:hypothetical protein